MKEINYNSKKENKIIDFKADFDPASTSDWCEIVKDIIAMANSGGGVILFGVKDDGKYSNIDKQKILKIDPAIIADKIQTYTGENFSDFEISEIKRGNKKIAAFVIGGTSIPIVFIKNGADVIVGKKQKPTFIKGTMYFRHGAKSEPGDTNDIRRSFDKNIDKIRKNWFKGMRQVSQIGTYDEVIIKKKEVDMREKTLLLGKISISENGRPVKFTNTEVDQLKKEYPLSYDDVIRQCKKKRKVPQVTLNNYIKSCKNDRTLALNWKTVAKNLAILSNVADKYTYSKKVVDDF